MHPDLDDRPRPPAGDRAARGGRPTCARGPSGSACGPGSGAASCAGGTGWRPPRPSSVRRRACADRPRWDHDGAVGATRTTPPATRPTRQRRRLTDAKEMRALAHPTRVAAIELLSREGPMTATQLGEMLDESPANISFHLRTLAKYGFVEEAPGGTGRERPWSRVGIGNSWELDSDDAATATAAVGLARHMAQRAVRAPQRVGAEPRRRTPRRGARPSFECYTHDVPHRRRAARGRRGDEPHPRPLQRPHRRPRPAAGRRRSRSRSSSRATRCRRPRRATERGRRGDRPPGARRGRRPRARRRARAEQHRPGPGDRARPRPSVRRDADPVHVTGSAFIVGPRGIVLLRHRRLGIWVQPGGHIDPGEAPWEGARREADRGDRDAGPPPRRAAGAGPRRRPPRRPWPHPPRPALPVHADDADPAPPADESQDVGWFGWDEAPCVAEPRMAGILAALAGARFG